MAQQYAVTHIVTGAVMKYGFTDFLNDYDPETEEVVEINEAAQPQDPNIPLYYYKIVASEFVAMNETEKAAVDAAHIPPISHTLTDFVNANAIVTDPITGVYGPFELMQVMTNRRELFNDTESPLYSSTLTPILGSNGILQDHVNRISSLESIHGELGWHEQEVKASLYTRPADLLIYYGWLNSFNSSVNGWNNESVAQDLAKYPILVFGDGIQDPSHGDYANTQVIIPRIKALNPNALIFGYVSTTNVIATFQTKATQWNTLGIHGIFMDEAGYDFGTNRVDFNTRVDYVHGLSSAHRCFVNAWNMDHILGTANDLSYPNTTYNPDLVASKLTYTDWYLLESFPINTIAYSSSDGYESKSDWAARGVKAIGHRATFGIKLAGVGIIDNEDSNGTALFMFGAVSALMWSLEAFGTSDTNYGASSAAIMRWSRPSMEGIGTTWSLSPSVQEDINDSDVYWRYVEFGRCQLDFSDGVQLSDLIFEGTEKDLHYERKRGTNNYESWYTSPCTGAPLIMNALVPNRLYVVPFVEPRRDRLNGIGIEVMAPFPGKIKLGIYSSDGNASPTLKLVETSEITATSPGTKTVDIHPLMLPGLKFLAILCDGISLIRCHNPLGLVHVLGYGKPFTGFPTLGFYTQCNYGTLPVMFPTSFNKITTIPIPAIFVRLSK